MALPQDTALLILHCPWDRGGAAGLHPYSGASHRVACDGHSEAPAWGKRVSPWKRPRGAPGTQEPDRGEDPMASSHRRHSSVTPLLRRPLWLPALSE